MHVRPIQPDDGPLIEAFHARQSSESIYFRYFSPRPRLSASDLEHLTNVDYLDRMAFVGLLGDDLIGIARYDRYPTSGKAEVAFFTDDAHQGRGMATVLLEYLAAAAREAGIDGFVAQVLPQNRKMLSVFKQVGFEVHSSFEDGVIEVELGIEPTQDARERMDERARIAFARSVRRILAPQSVAVIGASRRDGAIGKDMVRRVVAGGFHGPVFPVNPFARSVASIKSYRSVRDIPDDVDLALICVPATQVRTVVEDCARKHVRGLVIVSDLRALDGTPDAQAVDVGELLEFAHRHGMRVVGPNSLGVINTDPAVSLHATFTGTTPLEGSIGVLSQSGTLGAAIVGHARRLGLGISTFVSLGDKSDVSSNDLLTYWESDEATNLVLLHLESFGNPHNFARITRRLSRSKPVVAVKSGRSVRLTDDESGVAVDASLDVLLSETGVIRVDTLEQLFNVALVLARQPVPKGRRLAVLSNAWGPAMLAADAAAGAGLEMADLGPAGFTTNPVDLGFAAGPDAFGSALDRILQSGAADAVLVMGTTPDPAIVGDISRRVTEVGAGASLPIVATYLGMTPDTTDASDPIPIFEFPESAVYALGRIARYAAWLDRDPGTIPDAAAFGMEDLPDVIADLAPTDGSLRWLDLGSRSALLANAGFDSVASVLVDNELQAVEAANHMGWPVALKATGVTRPAKTEAGGIAVDIHDEASLRSAYRRMEDLLGDALHPAMIQQMAPAGVDVKIGMHRRAAFGSVISLQVDQAFFDQANASSLQVVPFSDTDARRLVEQAGFLNVMRDARAADALPSQSAEQSATHLGNLLLRLSVLAETCEEIAGVQFDQVLVSEHGAIITDAKIAIRRVPDVWSAQVRRIEGAADE